MHIVQKQGGYPDLRPDGQRREGQRAREHPGAAGPGRRAGGGGGAGRSRRRSRRSSATASTSSPAATPSIAVDFKDHIALVECGQSEARALAVIAEAKRLIPNKPIRYV